MKCCAKRRWRPGVHFSTSRHSGDPDTANKLRHQRHLVDGQIETAQILIEHITEQMQATEVDHIKAQITALTDERKQITAEGAAQAEEYEKLHRRYWAFREQYEGDRQLRGYKIDRIDSQIHDLEHRLQELEGETCGE